MKIMTERGWKQLGGDIWLAEWHGANERIYMKPSAREEAAINRAEWIRSQHEFISDYESNLTGNHI